MKISRAKSLPYGCELVIRFALGRYAGSIINQINLWLHQSGTEWTVSRLKSYWTAAKQLRAGNRSVVISIYQENSISYFKGSLYPRGPMKYPVEMFLLAQKPSVLRRSAAVLRCYTALVLDKVSTTQLHKASNAINGISTANAEVVQSTAISVGVWAKINLPESQTLKKVNVSRLKAFTSCHRTKSGGKEARERPYGLFGTSLLTSCYLPEPCQSLLDWELDEFRQILLESGADDTASGHIAFIQENGAKCRVVAVPNAWIQLVYEPLHIYLDKLIQSLPGSAMHDQNQGAYYIRQSMEANKPLYCFDLSSATDRFPLDLQTSLLESLGFREHAEGIRRLSDGWTVSVDGKKFPMWSYTVGQPMGLYGSFPLFHLTHLAVLDMLSIKVGSYTRDTRPFLVLGDDVLIRDSALADSYAKRMSDLGVEVSPTKSITSSVVAEFAGFVGVKTNKSVAVFRPYKHGINGRIHAPINLMYTLGADMGKYGPSWSKLTELFQRSRSWRNPDLSPLISQDERGAKMAPKLDSTRLSSLLKILLSINFPDMSQEDEFDDSNLLETVVCILLDKEQQASVDNRFAFGLTEPTVDDGKQQGSPESIVYCDPVIKKIILDNEESPCAFLKVDDLKMVPTSLCRKCTASICLVTGSSPDIHRSI